MSSQPIKKTVGIRELKDRTSEVIRQVVETGESIQVMNHNRVVARIVPVEPSDWRETLRALGLLAHESNGKGLRNLKLLPVEKGPNVDVLKDLNEDREDRF